MQLSEEADRQVQFKSTLTLNPKARVFKPLPQPQYHPLPQYDQYDQYPSNPSETKRQKLKHEKELIMLNIKAEAEKGKQPYTSTDTIFDLVDVSYQLIMDKLSKKNYRKLTDFIIIEDNTEAVNKEYDKYKKVNRRSKSTQKIKKDGSQQKQRAKSSHKDNEWEEELKFNSGRKKKVVKHEVLIFP
jgi:hypothetical protein